MTRDYRDEEKEDTKEGHLAKCSMCISNVHVVCVHYAGILYYLYVCEFEKWPKINYILQLYLYLFYRGDLGFYFFFKDILIVCVCTKMF